MQDNPLVIIDYSAGNIGSVINMFRRVGLPCRVNSSSKDIQTAAKIVIPGVGHFDYGMEQLERKGLLDVLNHAVLDRRISLLGICLGMQMMTQRSEEGNLQCLGWIEADVKKFKGIASEYRVPLEVFSPIMTGIAPFL